MQAWTVCLLAVVPWLGLASASPLKLSLLVPDFDAAKIPGKAGKDYPAYRDIPHTRFRCDNMVAGIYADRDTRCQVFHLCDVDTRRFTFMCPNGTVFNEKTLKCDWWNKVSCASPAPLVQTTSKSDKSGKPESTDESQPKAQDRTFDLVDSISDLIRYARRRNQDDEPAAPEETGGSRFREIMRRVLRILTTGL